MFFWFARFLGPNLHVITRRETEQEWACAALANILSNCTLDHDEQSWLALADPHTDESAADAADQEAESVPPSPPPAEVGANAGLAGDDFSAVGAVRLSVLHRRPPTRRDGRW